MTKETFKGKDLQAIINNLTRLERKLEEKGRSIKINMRRPETTKLREGAK